MKVSDHIFCFLLAVLLHVLGLLIVSNWGLFSPSTATTAPELDVTSVELSLADAEIDSPGPRGPEPQGAEPPSATPEPPTLQLPAPVEPATPEELPDKPDFTEALTPPPVLQPQPSPIMVPRPEPPKAVAASVPSAPATRQPPATAQSSAPSSSAAQATIQAVGGGGGGAYGRVDTHPSLQRAIKPNYPIGARRRGEEGTVILDVVVAADGSAAKISRVSSSGFEELDHAAERAAAQARFKPGTRDGAPVESAARLTLIFRLRDS